MRESWAMQLQLLMVETYGFVIFKRKCTKKSISTINEQKTWAQFVCDLTTPRMKDQRNNHTATAQ
jgi:hypothetical protein